ncbi:hypothetical protein FS837_003376 [Tulasnella sp. UAMH 9824]|nr:hypothetical protein FS837_003376 [Tulasnella sp. UAMH 9824]
MTQRITKSTKCTRSSGAPKRKRDKDIDEEGEPARHTDRRKTKRRQGSSSDVHGAAGAANRCYEMGEVYRSQGEYSKAKGAFTEARKRYFKLGMNYNRGRADSWYWLGEVYRVQENFSKAQESFATARKIYGTVMYEPGRAKASYWLGHVCHKQSNSKEAAEAFEQARDGYERVGDQRGVADASYWLGIVYRLRKNFDLARESFILAKTEYIGVGYELGQADTLYQLGKVESSCHQYVEAEGFLDEASKIFVRLGHEEGRGRVSLAQGKINISKLQLVQLLANPNRSSLGATNSNEGAPREPGELRVEGGTPVDPPVTIVGGDSFEPDFPPVSDIGHLITWIAITPFGSGGFADVFEGMHSDSEIGKVALKRIKNPNDSDVIRRFEREAATWSRLRHAHVLKLLGTLNKDGQFYLVSPFQIHGSLKLFAERNPTMNKIKLLREAADGLSYLHENDIIHGDIRGTNILISDLGGALICDFGLSKMKDSNTSTGQKGAGSSSWMSPEVLLGGHKTFQSDAYSFGMTIAEVGAE